MQPEQVSDAELIVRVRSGDTAAMGELYARHHEAALRVARATSGDAHLAEDLVSSAFERTHGAIERGAGPVDSFRAYLYTVIRRLAVEAGIRKSREQDTDDWSPYEASTAVGNDTDRGLEAQLVAKAFQTLPERQQAVLWYLEVEGLTPLQAAPHFGLSPNATSALAVRARDALRVAYLQAHVSDHPIHAECGPTRRLLGGYLRSTLSQRDAGKVEDHLKACDECPLVLEELKDVGYGLKAVFGALLVGGGVVGSFLAAIGGRADGAMAAGLVGIGGGAAAAGSGSGGSGGAGQSKQAMKAAAAAVAVLAALGIATGVSAAMNAGASSTPFAAPAAPVAADPSPADPEPAAPVSVPTPDPVEPSAAPVEPAPVEPEPAPVVPVDTPPVAPALPPTAALQLDFVEDELLPDGSWRGRVVVIVQNSNATPIGASLDVRLPAGVVVDPTRGIGGVESWSCGALADPIACAIASIPVGGQSELVLPVLIAADAVGARPVANLSVTPA